MERHPVEEVLSSVTDPPRDVHLMTDTMGLRVCLS